MARRIRQAGVAVVPVHVEVAEFQIQVAVVDEIGLCGRGQQASANDERTEDIAR
ncbi:hypothetical protein D3C78_1588670 [compost metagenome]